MQELDDNALLREYVERGSEEAFAALVTRHVNKVYSVALRHTRNPDQAGEITQAVFVILAAKSRHLHKRVILSGWLYQAARLTAVTFIRSEIRRARRENEAHMQNAMNKNESDAWTQIAPLLDAAMAGLNETDRHAVVLRYFDGKSMREVGAALGADEDTARKRVNRAVEKLQGFFAKRGINSTTAAITGAISANSVQMAPAALAKSATAAALSKGAAASGANLTLIKGALKLMAWTKAKTTVAVSLGILLAGAAGITVYEAKERTTREKDIVAYEIEHQSPLQKMFPQRVDENKLRQQLVGVWAIEAKKFRGNAKYTQYPKDNHRLKIWTSTNWSIVTYDADSNVVYSASGPYELQGNNYTETIESATGGMTNFLGERPQFKIRVDGDKYYQMAPGKNPGLEEIGHRIQ